MTEALIEPGKRTEYRPGHYDRNETREERFAQRYVVNGESGCWEWMGAVNEWGYGTLGRDLAHRLSWAFAGRKLPVYADGYEFDHRCRNRRCVNPDHLEVVSRRENQLRGNGPCGLNARKTHCSKGHALSGDNVIWGRSKNGQKTRRCRACNYAWAHAWRRRVGRAKAA